MDEDSRRFVSQETGHLYIAKVEPSDVGNYTCVVTSTATAARVLGAPTPLVLRSDGTPRSRGTPGGRRAQHGHGRVRGSSRVATAVLSSMGVATALAP